ncbi:SDR family NAD(P)-dependent oxidoreductase [Methylorubrum salsuginis]|uniref:NAD(P)-dependent dehydrogenase, short-chain alcohol dehydrogenase family n=1 Tax=Methylorubrum salsuginis TaxID=414703 RepID=A0A1I4K0S7_9HYPH|nr:SDR family NAD(P)-dependent oxidoreductase [Methylorubrum salsuginis]SFL72379.1 NAD(P)-dependent dehydrogenase, short-chain alcohol dehydrogenase family [Methylorubrum salsuginis]
MRRRALVVGASRGLGLGLVVQFLARGWAVTATVRQPSAALADLAMGNRLQIEAGVDIDDDAAVADLRARLAEVPDFDIVFVVAGIATQAGTPAALLPREIVGAVFQTNAVSPIRFAEAFHRRVAPGGLIVLMTSKLGSVALNRGGGWSSYRASKAALNTLARSFAGQHEGADWGVVLMHPGWVRTDLGGRRATLAVETSARGMVGVLESRLGQRGCHFLDYTGEMVPW